MRSFTSSFPVLSFVYVGWLSFNFVYLCLFIVFTKFRPAMFDSSCPKSSCLLLKSPVIIVFVWFCMVFVNSSVDGFPFGQYIVVICMLSVGVFSVIVCCRLCVWFSSCISS